MKNDFSAGKAGGHVDNALVSAAAPLEREALFFNEKHAVYENVGGGEKPTECRVGSGYFQNLLNGVARIAPDVIAQGPGALGKLGAALGEKGDLPRWLAPGAAPGEIPRRALAVTAVIALAYFALMVATGNRLDQFILFHTANMVAIYAAGMIAAVLLLPRFSLGWWLAAIATLMSGALLLLAGWYLVAPGALAVAAVIVELARRRGLRL